MSRTRKWALVAQEAVRLAALGLSPFDIAKRLDVNKSTVTRWMATGKLARTQGRQASRPEAPAIGPSAGQTPSEWAKSVRDEYKLDVTDDQLVNLAELALELSLNKTVAPHVRMAAAGRFQALVRQLALVARSNEHQGGEPVAPTPPPEPTTKRAAGPRPPRRPGTDPRRGLMALVAK
jgi:hypothetical protein